MAGGEVSDAQLAAIKQGNPQWDRFWGYNITFGRAPVVGTPENLTLVAKALGKAREAYGFGFRYVGPDITTYKGWGLNQEVFSDGEKGFRTWSPRSKRPDRGRGLLRRGHAGVHEDR